jgi:hypothetical protein
MNSRIAAAMLVLSLMAGFLISILLYPPATIGAAIATVALGIYLGRVSFAVEAAPSRSAVAQAPVCGKEGRADG